MIRFLGELEGESRRFLLRRQSLLQMFIWGVSTVIVGVPIVAFALSWKMLILWCYVAYVVIFMFICLLPPTKQAQKTFMPKEVFIDLTDEMIVQKSEKNERFRELSSIKSVLDYGDWYYFKFYFGNKDQYFICQKSLLIEGTIDDFESLFEDKIIRKK